MHYGIEMESFLYAMMVASAPALRARKIGSVRQYVQNDDFCNLVQNIDINSPKRFNYGLFTAFNGIPGLREQVNAWALSG